jgi:Domain of unknown function (DUF4832)/Beta-galactosidase
VIRGRGSILALLVIGSSLLWAVQSCRPRTASFENGIPARQGAAAVSSRDTVTARPTEIDDVLYNPGMGFADFHFAIGSPLPFDQHPRSTVAYIRWSWGELEPFEGQYNFGLVDHVIEQARAMGETLAFRIMTEPRVPAWLLAKGVASVKVTGGIFPDFNDPILLGHHEKLIRAFGARYANSPDVDHVDIGSVGCWGEWNTACCRGAEALCKRYYPTPANQIAITDWYLEHFKGTPLVMLVGGQLEYAVSRGSGWRGDCFGDYGMFGPNWNHMDHVYEPAAQDPVIGNAWKHGPVQFEVCGVMQDWYDKGFDIDRILKKGLEWHASVVNAGYAPVPAAWRPRVDEFLKKLGYRMVLREMTHPAEAKPGDTLPLRTRWQNVGVAPIYHRWPMAYRLRSSSDQVVAQWTSPADLQQWRPGVTQEVEDLVAIPDNVPAATYSLDVAILSQDGRSAHVDLAIAGKRRDRWYPVSTLAIRN